LYSSWSNYKSSTFVLSSTVAQELLQREAYNNVCLVQACLLFPAARLMRDLNVSYACPQLCRQTDSCVCVCVRAQFVLCVMRVPPCQGLFILLSLDHTFIEKHH
jgi:hypothetical protein